MQRRAFIGHGRSALMQLATIPGLVSSEDLAKVQACNMSPEEIAERDRPISRQERRKREREARKGQTHLKEDVCDETE